MSTWQQQQLLLQQHPHQLGDHWGLSRVPGLQRSERCVMSHYKASTFTLQGQAIPNGRFHGGKIDPSS